MVSWAGPHGLDDAGCARLLGFLSRVTDSRDRRGRRYGLAYLLAIAVVAMMAGDGELASIGEWAAGAPAELLAALGDRADGSVTAPDAATITRALQDADGDELDLALCAWTAALRRERRGDLLRSIHVDGKAEKGAARARKGLKAPMLLSALCDAGTVLAQLAVDTTKINEIPVFRKLMALIGCLAGAVITADQMHTQRKHATYLRKRGAHYVFTIGENQPKLYAAVGALPWKRISGRARHRRLRPWPRRTAHHRRAARHPRIADLFRTRPPLCSCWNATSTTWTATWPAAVAVLGITSLPPGDDGAGLMAYVRGHWSIEVLHHVRSPGVTWPSHEVAPSARRRALQQTSMGVVLLVAAALSFAVSGQGRWCNTCGVTRRC